MKSKCKRKSFYYGTRETQTLKFFFLNISGFKKAFNIKKNIDIRTRIYNNVPSLNFSPGKAHKIL